MPNTFAEVRAHGRVMRYRRWGSGGGSVLLLGPVEQTEALAARFRVIVPELPDPGSDIAPWLAAFLEGLGTQDVVVVAADQYRAAALELARTDPDRVERVVLASDLTRFLGGG